MPMGKWEYSEKTELKTGGEDGSEPPTGGLRLEGTQEGGRVGADGAGGGLPLSP